MLDHAGAEPGCKLAEQASRLPLSLQQTSSGTGDRGGAELDDNDAQPVVNSCRFTGRPSTSSPILPG